MVCFCTCSGPTYRFISYFALLSLSFQAVNVIITVEPTGPDKRTKPTPAGAVARPDAAEAPDPDATLAAAYPAA